MVNIGILGSVSAGKTTLLRLFVKMCNKKDKIKELGSACTLLKIDFSGESTLDLDRELENKETKTIHPNRVYFKEDDTGINHTLFAPGGDKERAVVRMGIITISRIAKQIVTIFSLDKSLKEQFEFFDTIRHFPKDIYVCFNKFDLVDENQDDEKYLKKLKDSVTKYFSKRKIKIKEIFFTCAEAEEEFTHLNDNATQMILQIVKSNTVSVAS